MSTEYRLSLWCGALPLACGISLFALWYLIRAAFLAEAALALLRGGWMLIVVGLISLLLHLSWQYHIGIVSRPQLLRQGLLSGGLLLANFPAAAAVIAAAAFIASSYTLCIQNRSGQTVSSMRVTGGGVAEDLGTLRPGELAVRRLWFSEDGSLGFDARLGDRVLEETVENYVTNGLGGDATVVVKPNGSIEVQHNDDD
jgi:hypothetical protein